MMTERSRLRSSRSWRPDALRLGGASRLHSPPHPTANTHQLSLPPVPAVPTASTHVPDAASPLPHVAPRKVQGDEGGEGETGWGHGPPTPTVGSGRPPKGEPRGEGSRRPLPAQLQQARVRPRKGSPFPPHYRPLPGSVDGPVDLRRATHVPSLLRLRGLRAHRPLLDPRSSNREIFAILTTKAEGFSKMTTIHWASLK
jgi:hypothetical protein